MALHNQLVTALTFTILVILTAATATTGLKLNFEDCRFDSECESPRTCLTRTHQGKIIACSPEYPLCMCGKLPVESCATSLQCETKGEHCARTYFMPFATCISCMSPLSVTAMDDTCYKVRSTMPSVTRSGGLTADYCKRDGLMLPHGCVGTRICGNMPHGIYSPCTSLDNDCYCLEIGTPACQSSNDCVHGERCINHILAHATMCVSCNTPFLASIFKPVDLAPSC